MSRKSTAAMAATMIFAASLTGCTPLAPDPSPTSSPSGSVQSSTPKTTLRVLVNATPGVLAAYEEIGTAFTKTHPNVTVRFQTYTKPDLTIPTASDLVSDGVPVDLFMADQGALASLSKDKLIAPVDELLGQRGLDFGDGYDRTALEAFSADAHLQCMPTEISPKVVYYNPALVKLRRLVPKGDEIPSAENGWTYPEFAKAVRRASERTIKGVEVGRDLAALAPFILAGGGSVVDDAAAPTTLTLSTPESIGALRPLLRLLRNPDHTFTPEQLARRSAVDRFKDGTLAMIVGDRSLTPILRAKENFIFGAMPIPRGSRSATTATISGFCLSQGAKNRSDAADLLAYLASTEAATTLAQTGAVVPTNILVLRSEAFAQSGQSPRGATAFSDQMRAIKPLPVGAVWADVVAQTEPAIGQLFMRPVIDPLSQRLAVIDESSKQLFAAGATG